MNKDGGYGSNGNMEVLPMSLGVLFLVTLILITFTVLSKYEDVEREEAVSKLKEEQIAEGRSYTSKVETINLSKGEFRLENGDVVPSEGLVTQPDIGDVVTYIRTFGYEKGRWTHLPEKTDKEVIINLEIIGKSKVKNELNQTGK